MSENLKIDPLWLLENMTHDGLQKRHQSIRNNESW